MRYAPLALLLVAITATAAPAPTLAVIEVKRSQIGDLFAPELPAAEDDPGGLFVPQDADPQWFALGLKAGDVIRFLDGVPAAGRIMMRDGLNLLEIERNGRTIMLRILVHGPSTDTKRLTATDFDDLIARLARPEIRSTVVRRGNTPSGVRITDFILDFRLDLELGDIVRSFDGQPIVSDKALAAAITNMKVGTTRILITRHGRPVTLEITRDAPLALSTVKRVSATRYEIPKALADAVQEDVFLVTQKLDVVPVVVKSKVRGVRIYNIQSDAPAAAVGLQDDDIILDLEGRPIATAGDGVAALHAIAGMAQFALHIERKGKPMTITYVIR